MNMKYAVQPFTKENAADFCRLYKAVYGKNKSIASVIGKFSVLRPSNRLLGFLAYDEQTPVAFYGAVAVKMVFQNSVELAAQSVDTMTHPEYRGQGLFIKLASLTYQQLQEEGFSFIFGFPNQYSESGFLNKLGWQYNERMNGYSICARQFSVEKITRRIPFIKNLHASFVNAIFAKYKTDRFPKKSIPQNYVSVDRDSDYQKYKMNPGSFVIAIDNCLFWIKLGHGLQIGEVEAPNQMEFSNAVQKLTVLCRRCGISTIVFQLSPELPINEWIKERNASRFDSWIVGHLNFNSTFTLERLKFTLADIDIF